MAITSSFANLATVTRASKKTDAGGWDFTSGGTVGTLTEYASGVAALHATAGLLVEESSTNENRNPRFEGATVGTLGSGGALPTNFSNATGGMTWSVNGVGTENGWDYLEISLSGTASSDARLDFEVGNQISALAGEDWTFSVGVKVVSGTFPGTLNFWLRGLTSGLLTSNSDGVDIPDGSIDGSHRRLFLTKAMNDDLGTTTYVRPSIYIDNPTGAVSCTFRLYAPQCENKAYPTSPILPEVSSPAATTRAADALGIADGAWSSSVASTWYIDAQMVQPQGLGATRYFAGGNGNARWLYYSGQGLSFYDGATIYAAPNSATLAAGDTIKGVSAFDASGVSIAADFSLSVGTGVAPNLSNLDPSTPGGVGLGATYGAAAAASFYLRDLRYWPRRLSDAELQALVGI